MIRAGLKGSVPVDQYGISNSNFMDLAVTVIEELRLEAFKNVVAYLRLAHIEEIRRDL